jgi:O-antigen ligase
MKNKALSILSLNIIFLLILTPFGFALNISENFDLAVIRILIPIIFLIWLFKGLFNKKLILDFRLRSGLLLFILILSSISFFWSINEIKALRKILFLGSIFPLYWFMVYFFRRKANFELFLKILSGTALVSSLVGLIQFISQFIFGLNSVFLFQSKITPFFLGNNFSEMVLLYNSWLVNINGVTLFRAVGLFPDPHLFSLFLNISLPIILFLFLKTKHYFYLINFSIVLITSLLTFSRAGYLSLIMAVIFCWLFFLKKKNIWNILLILFFMLFLIIPNPINQRLYSTFNLKDGSIKERIHLLETSLKITQNNFWGGVGIGNLSEVIQPQSDTRTPIYAHNLFLDFSSEIGFFGGLAVLILVFIPILNYFRKPSTKNFLLAIVFVIIFTHSMFETPFYSVRVLPLILTFLAI